MDNPCRYCADYPNACRGLCIDKMKYINETDREISTIHRNEEPIKVVKSKSKVKSKVTDKTRVTDKVKVKPVIVDTNKNGIRRERVSR